MERRKTCQDDDETAGSAAQIIRGEVQKGLPPVDLYMAAAEQRAAELRVLAGTPSRNRLGLL